MVHEARLREMAALLARSVPGEVGVTVTLPMCPPKSPHPSQARGSRVVHSEPSAVLSFTPIQTERQDEQSTTGVLLEGGCHGS